MEQVIYMKKVADMNYDKFMRQGRADAGHNGPHGHKDSPVRNTAHYLIIYSYLYKTTKEEKYLELAGKLAEYIFLEASKSKSGAIECMLTDRFDHLNGLIGQGWVIEGLLYYYDLTKDQRCIEVSRQLFYAQKYDYNLHLWHRIELDGRNIGIDPTYNHNIWFAACASKLLDYGEDIELKNILTDLLVEGTKRDFRIYSNGLLYHSVVPAETLIPKFKLKRNIKRILYPVKFLNQKKFDYQYIEKAYHLFDLYGFCILEEKFPDLPIFSSEKYKKARSFALDIENINKMCGAGKKDGKFNAFFYSYNTPAFEFPYLSLHFGEVNYKKYSELFEIQKKMMYSKDNDDFTVNNPDLISFQARTYEIIRFCDLIDMNS